MASIAPPGNVYVDSLLTDMYQLTMAYSYWVGGRHEEHTIFELFHRKNPFKGQFTLFAGLEEAIRFVANFKFTEEQVAYVKDLIPGCNPGFLEVRARARARATGVQRLAARRVELDSVSKTSRMLVCVCSGWRRLTRRK